MTGQERVQAGGVLGPASPKSGHLSICQDLSPGSNARSRPSAAVCLSGESSKKLSPASASVGLSSPLRTTKAFNQPTAVAGRNSIVDAANASSSSTNLVTGGERVRVKSKVTSQHQRTADENALLAPDGASFSPWTAPVDLAKEYAGRGMEQNSQSLPQGACDGLEIDGTYQDTWQIVTKKTRSTRRARASKAMNSTLQTVEAPKETSARPAPFVLTPVQVSPPSLSTADVWPHLSLSCSSPSTPHLMPTVQKPSYAVVASLRSPLKSFSSSTASSADAPFMSAPQTPEQVMPKLNTPLDSPTSSHTYFSAAEDGELLSKSPRADDMSLECLDPCKASNSLLPALIDSKVFPSSQHLDPCVKQVSPACEVSTASSGSKNGCGVVAPTRTVQWSPVMNRLSKSHPSISESDGLTASNENHALAEDYKCSLECFGEASSTSGPKDDSKNPRSPRTESLLEDRDGKMLARDHSRRNRERNQEAGTGAAGGYKKQKQRGNSGRYCPENKSESSTGEPARNHPGNSITKSTSCVTKDDQNVPASNQYLLRNTKRGRARKHKEHSRTIEDDGTGTSTQQQEGMGDCVRPRLLLDTSAKTTSNTLPPTVPTSLHHGQSTPASASTSPEEIQELSSRSPRRGRAADRFRHGIPTNDSLPREGSILRGEAPEFTPQTTPSKSEHLPFRMVSPGSLDPLVPADWTRSQLLHSAALSRQELHAPTQPMSLAGATSEKVCLMPWMSKDFWMVRSRKPVVYETRCPLVGHKAHHNAKERLSRVGETSNPGGQIRRLKPCGVIKVQWAVEQIGVMCPKCNPDH
ncbi:hypothetical protein MMC16_004840 [Acarospora aff. strigata]|nr:hypothetical protein [Acarospora aff. strigata]